MDKETETDTYGALLRSDIKYQRQAEDNTPVKYALIILLEEVGTEIIDGVAKGTNTHAQYIRSAPNCCACAH